MLFAEAVELIDESKPRITKNGYLVADVRCARSGIQLYSGAELGKPELDIVRVYRPPEEVFAKSSIASYVGKPLTDDHPPEQVTAENWKTYARGHIGEGALRDGEWIRVPIVMMDGATIKQWQDGKRELSMGYSCDIDWGKGVSDSGQEYDARIRNIETNHTALVDKARAGSQARVGDIELIPQDRWLTPQFFQTTPIQKTMPENMTSVTVGDRSVQTTEAGSIIVADLLKNRDELQKQLADRDKELAKRDAEIADLESKILSDKELDRRVNARAKLIADAKLIAKDVEYNGISDSDIRRRALFADGRDIADKSEAYIEAAFDFALDAAKKTDPIREAFLDRDRPQPGDNGQAKYEQRLRDAWRAKAA